MKHKYLKISFTLLLILNYYSLVNAQNESSLIPPSISTPITNNGEILILQEGKPTLSYKSYNDNGTIKMIPENLTNSTYMEAPRELIPPTYSDDSGVIVGVPQIADPATFPKDTKVIEGGYQEPTPSTNYTNTTPKTYADDDNNSNTTPEEEIYTEPRELVPPSSSSNNANTPSTQTLTQAQQNTTQRFSNYQEAYNYYKDQYYSNPDRNTGLIADSLLSKPETKPQGVIVGIRVEDDTSINSNPNLSSNNNTPSQFGYSNDDIVFKNPATSDLENQNTESLNQSTFNQDNFGFYSEYDVPSQKHGRRNGE